ncbi:MAG: hypothetical protein RMJ43_06330 [Chloroherpetonaceae bacterium]|nr:hypothetical protein [Chthonomonadaceae bacterium]MDW8207435.1 hypothetical protein [Chloroherpetonaceae bacterium]
MERDRGTCAGQNIPGDRRGVDAFPDPGLQCHAVQMVRTVTAPGVAL